MLGLMAEAPRHRVLLVHLVDAEHDWGAPVVPGDERELIARVHHDVLERRREPELCRMVPVAVTTRPREAGLRAPYPMPTSFALVGENSPPRSGASTPCGPVMLNR